MLAIGGLFENAAIEIEPGQFPVDEAFRARDELGGDVPRCRFGKPHRGFEPPGEVGLKRDGGGLATIGHDYSWFFELHPRRPA
jgi:hypothetical protein